MFQCFVDDRYEGNASAKAKDLEVLFFDEYIDQHINSKHAPFLNDTSQAHNKANRFVCLLPNKETLPKGFSSRYLTFPSKLDHTLFGALRPVKPLVSKEEEAAVQNKMDMSKVRPRLNAP